MYHYKARIYSPTLGRFLQTDPIGYDDQVNLYAYVANDPVDGRDPSGMNTCSLAGNGGACSGEYAGSGISAKPAASPPTTSAPISTSQSTPGQAKSQTQENGSSQSGNSDPNVITVTARRTTLPNLNASTFFGHFLGGNGDTVVLTPGQFKSVVLNGRVISTARNRNGVGYSQLKSYYGTSLANTFGSATVTLDDDFNPVGFHDIFNFDMHSRSSYGAQIMTGIGAAGYLLGGRDFEVTYP